MVNVRDYKESDFEEVVDMYYKMCLEVYPHREFNGIQTFYYNVLRWIDLNYDIIVTEDNGVLTGFGMSFVDNMGGIVPDYYQGECIYIKPEYRKGRSAWMIYKTFIGLAEQLGMILSTNASDITESSHISNKLGIKVFSKFEKMP